VTQRIPRRAGARVPLLALVPIIFGVAACGDDANDHALLAQRLTDRLAAQPAATMPSAPGDVPADTSAATVEPVAAVEPTGVVVPVVALDNSFRPLSVEAEVGDEVVWENRGRNEHDVLSVAGTLADGTAWGITVDDFQPGAIFAHVFSEPGEYRYYCTIHGTAEVGMVGTVVVTDKGETS
jgi:plastocyanin